MSNIKHRMHVCLVAAARVGDDVEVIAGVGDDQIVDDAACQSSNLTSDHIVTFTDKLFTVPLSLVNTVSAPVLGFILSTSATVRLSMKATRSRPQIRV